MLVLTGEDVRNALPMSRAVEVIGGAFAQLSAGRADVPLRTSLEVPRHDGVTLVMPAHLSDDDAMAVKIVSVFKQNPDRGLPLIHAAVLVVNAETGKPEAVMDGTYLTALRTGAASGAATDVLARHDSHAAAVFGAGAQGRTQLEAVCAVRPIDEAWLYDVHQDRAEMLADELSESLSILVRAAETPSQTMRAADVVCTATTSARPVFSDADVRPGTHINAIGAYTPQMQEIPTETVLRAKVVVDQREAALAEAGDLLIPMEQGLMTSEDIYAEVGAIISGRKAGRETAQEITLFKAVGVAAQDAAAAHAVLEAAHRLGLGTEVAL